MRDSYYGNFNIDEMILYGFDGNHFIDIEVSVITIAHWNSVNEEEYLVVVSRWHATHPGKLVTCAVFLDLKSRNLIQHFTERLETVLINVRLRGRTDYRRRLLPSYFCFRRLQ